MKRRVMRRQGRGGRRSTGCGIVALGILAALWFAPNSPAATITLGQLAPATAPAGGCNLCTNFQLATATPSPSYTVPPGNWVLTSWRASGGEAGGTVKLRLFRPTATPEQFTVIAESPYEVVGAGLTPSFPVRIVVQPGDVLGLETGPSPQTYPSSVASASGDKNAAVSGGPALGNTVGPGGDYSYFSFNEELLNIAATLTTATETLRVTKNGAGAGTVTSSPAGIDCGSSCATSLALDSAVSLAASAAPRSVFAGWSGGGCSGTGACELSLLDDTEVSATFTPSAPSVPVSPSRCLVPKLKGRQLKAAKKIIRKADCKLGNVKKLKGATAKTGKIKRQSPKSGTVLAPGAKVNIKLGG